MHVGNNNYSGNNYYTTHNYTAARQRSDAILHDQQRNQAFLDSAAEGQLQRLKYLWTPGIDIDYSDDNGFTALHHAVLSGFEDVVEYLWNLGCNVNAQSLEHGTPVCLAALRGRERIVKYLVDDRRRGNVNATGRSCGTPLHCAASSGHVPTIEALLVRGADVHASNIIRPEFLGPQSFPQDVSRTEPMPMVFERVDESIRLEPLMVATMRGHLGAVQALLKGGSKPDSRVMKTPTGLRSVDVIDGDGTTPLMCACARGYLEICAALLNGKADVNATGVCGYTALHAALHSGNFECVESLLKYQPDLSITDMFRQTPLMAAVETGATEMVKLLCSKVSQRSTQAGSDPFGEGILFKAVKIGDLDIVTALCDAGAAIDGPDSDGVTPALAAAVENNEQIFQFLRKRGADMLKRNKLGATLSKAVLRSGKKIPFQILCYHASSILQIPSEECTFVQGISDQAMNPDEIDPDLDLQCLDVVNSIVRGLNDGSVTMDGIDWALFQAAWYGHWQMIKVLLRQGADPRTEDKDKRTPMFYAASFGHVMVVRTLFEAGVSLRSTVFEEASKKGRVEVLDFLCETAGLSLKRYLRRALRNCKDDEVKAYLMKRQEELKESSFEAGSSVPGSSKVRVSTTSSGKPVVRPSAHSQLVEDRDSDVEGNDQSIRMKLTALMEYVTVPRS